MHCSRASASPPPPSSNVSLPPVTSSSTAGPRVREDVLWDAGSVPIADQDVTVSLEGQTAKLTFGVAVVDVNGFTGVLLASAPLGCFDTDTSSQYLSFRLPPGSGIQFAGRRRGRSHHE